MQALFVGEKPLDPDRFKERFSDKRCTREPVHQFLYLQGGLATGNWLGADTHHQVWIRRMCQPDCFNGIQDGPETERRKFIQGDIDRCISGVTW